MTIDQILSNIRNAVYGRDMRQAIYEGVDKCYSERLPGGYNPVSDINTYYSGIALFSETTQHRPPFNAPFMLVAAGNETNCCQIAYDYDNANSPMRRKKESGSWSDWSSV